MFCFRNGIIIFLGTRRNTEIRKKKKISKNINISFLTNVNVTFNNVNLREKKRKKLEIK